jgi:hypothetical protein
MDIGSDDDQHMQPAHKQAINGMVVNSAMHAVELQVSRLVDVDPVPRAILADYDLQC